MHTAQNANIVNSLCIGDGYLAKIKELDDSLTRYFLKKIIIDEALTRKLVSFQAKHSWPVTYWPPPKMEMLLSKV